jgi:hypothetical protein
MRQRKWHILMYLVLTASLLIPLLAWSYVSLFTRYWFDDFCYASAFHELGLVGSLSSSYQQWTGRFNFILPSPAHFFWPHS